jgi:Tfp pilus assembly protein PilV
LVRARAVLLKRDTRFADVVYGRVRSIDPDKRPGLARLRACWAAAWTAAGCRLRSERGSALIEVMVGAVVLSIATVGLLNGIDGAQSAGAKNKARSIAAALAEQDIERMRAMKATQLAGYTNTNTVTVRGVDYTIVSKGSWAVDSGGPISCSNISRTAANIRIVSEVTSNATKGVVDQVSLVTPPPGTYAAGEGRAIVKVQDRNGDPVQGMTVNLTGTATLSGTTNSLGCAVFAFIPVGNYTANPVGLGYVDWDGNATPSKSLTVNQSQSTAVNFEMDNAATIQAFFDTAVNGVTATTAAESRWLTVANSKLVVGSELFTAGGTSPATATQINATSLFPFLDGYSVYPGQCAANAAGAKTYTPTPGQILSTSTNKLRLPSINVRVVTSTSLTAPGPAGVNGAVIRVKPTSGCANTFPAQTGASVTYGSTTYAGAIPKPGYPYGSYQICADLGGRRGFADVPPYTSAGPTSSETVNNTAAAGNNVTWASGLIRIYVPTSGTTGTCTAAGY